MSASNKEEGPLTRSSAKASAEFLVEFLSENHPPGLLPVKLDVLREALWQEESGGSISCPNQKGGVDLKGEDPSCPSSGQCQCSVRKLLVMWQEAGIKTLADAGLNDLEAWQFTESYREHQPDLAGGVLANMKGHLDYLSEENFVFSLASRRVRSEEKRDIVDHLLSLEVVDTSFLPPPAPKRGEQKVEIPKPLQTSRGTSPSLAEFVGPKSWLVFDRLNLSIGSLDWMLEDDINKWVEYQSYNEFCDFVMKLSCTNDEAERNIKLLQDNLKDGQTLEDVLQDNLLLVSAHRKLVKSDKAGNRTKANLSQMGKLNLFN